MIPEGTDAISPAPHHDIYSIEDLRQLVFSLKEATEYKKPVIVKIAAVHNVAAIASGYCPLAARTSSAIDGFRGGTGAAPTRIRDNVGIPIELALARCRPAAARRGHPRSGLGRCRRLHPHRPQIVVKAIALGADAVLHRDRRPARHGLPPVPHLPDRQVQLGHRDPASRAGQAPQPGYRLLSGWSTW